MVNQTETEKPLSVGSIFFWFFVKIFIGASTIWWCVRLLFPDWLKVSAKGLQGYLYTYSSLAQSLAALLGVLGVFLVFRLQLQHSFILGKEERLRKFFASRDGIHAESSEAFRLTKEELLKKVENMSNEDPEKFKAKEVARQLKQAERRREYIKLKSAPLALTFTVLTVLSLLLIAPSENFGAEPKGILTTQIILSATAACLTEMLSFTVDCMTGE